MTQVHKENLERVENAIPGRQGLEVEIFGMEGVPTEIIERHQQAVKEKHFAEQAERERRTGNPARGTLANGEARPNKRTKVNEDIDDLEQRAEQYRTDRENGVLPPPVAETTEEPVSMLLPRHQANEVNTAAIQTPPAAQPFASSGQFSSYPPGVPGGPSLPQRPGFGAPPPGGFAPGEAISASLDDLITSVQKDNGADALPPTAEKKVKKERNFKLVFYDETISPEEKMAQLPRYGQYMET